MPTYILKGSSPEKLEISRLTVASGDMAASMFEAALADAKDNNIDFEGIAPRSVNTPYLIEQLDGDAAGRTGTLIDGKWCTARAAKVKAANGGFTVEGSDGDGPTLDLAVFPNNRLAFWFAQAWRAGAVPPLRDSEVQAALAAAKGGAGEGDAGDRAASAA